MASNLARSGAPRRSRRGDQTYLSLGQRFVTLAVYLLLLYAFHVAVTEHWEVSLSDSGLWLVSAIGFLSYSLLDTPFFVPPREALATAWAQALSCSPSTCPTLHL